MPTEQRATEPESTLNSLARAKEFAEATIALPIESVLLEANLTKNIGKTAVLLASKSHSMYDRRSMGTIRGAYEDVHQLMLPSIRSLGVDDTVELFNQPSTKKTISYLAGMTTNADMMRIVRDYAKGGNNLQVTDEGLVTNPNYCVPVYAHPTEIGCPFANSRLFDTLTDRVVETYTTAYRGNMPYGWLDRINRTIVRK